ncbi:MAG TPA: hypothetical protein VKX25_09620 [Bryobacteraceae bacterium]|jgi:hypothetical protein|nr:hypothetical protein [Bryobacteraceae bacterium]
MIAAFRLETLLAGAYIILLMLIAFALECMARHTQNRAERFHTGGFRFDPNRDVWECPTGMALVRTEVNYEQRIVRYRAPAHACNNCAIKSRCTHSDRGREIPVSMDPMLVSGSVKFQIGFSIILFTLAACIAAIELLRHTSGTEAWAMAVLLAIAVLLIKHTAVRLRDHSGFSATSPKPDPLIQIK